MTKAGKLFVMVAAMVATMAVAAKPAHAVPVLGGQLFGLGGDVTVEILDSDALFVNKLFLEVPLNNVVLDNIATNTTPVGSTFNLGSWAAGAELVFGIEVNDTEIAGGPTVFRYRMGEASRNPDSVIHAQVEFLSANEAIVEFEDKNVGTPGYDNDLNDLRFRFVGVGSEPVIPEPASMLLFGLGLMGAGLRARKRS